MEKIKIVKDGIIRSINEKDAQKWAVRGYKRVDGVAKATAPKAKAKAQ